MNSHNSQEHSEVYEQIHGLASRHGSKMVQLALDVARSSQEVQRRDSNLGDLDNLKPERRTAHLRLGSEEDEFDLPAISSVILNAVLENQLHNRPLVKLDLDVHGTISGAEMSEFCMEQVQSLRDYSHLLSKRNPFEDQGQVTGSVFGTLTLTTICPHTVETFLCDIGILSLFDTLCVNLEGERGSHVPRNVVDRLRNCIAESFIQHLRLSHCSMHTRDLKGLCYTGNFESIRLKNVTAVDPPGTINSSSPRTTQHAVRKVHVSIGMNQNFHQSVEFLPSIHTLEVPSGREESIVQHVRHFRGLNEIQVTISTTAIVQASLNRLFSFFGLEGFESLRHFSVVANTDDDEFFAYLSDDEMEEFKTSEKIYARRLFQWAVSPNCRWHSISLEIGSPEYVFEALEEVANSDDAQAPLSGIHTSKLRMFKLGRYAVCTAGMTRLLNLLTVHLPYCYYMGNAWRDRGTDEINTMLSQQVALQLERNHVGMALLHPDVFPGIPAGVWPRILANATGSKGGAEIPWTGMYCLIKELVKREVIASTSSVYQAHRTKRQKTDS